MDEVTTIIRHAAHTACEAARVLAEETTITFMRSVAALLAHTFEQGGKVLIAGNGGSMCDAMHCAEELTGCFRAKRKAFPALALSEVGHITCVGNDFGFDEIFARGVEAFGRQDDVLIVLSTSGKSPNILHAVAQARCAKMRVVAFLGKGGGPLAGEADYELIVPTYTTSDRIQEIHMAALHIIVEAVEALLT